MRALLALLLLVPTAAFARVDTLYPMTSFYPDSVGILYPGFAMAGGVNPAALPTSGRGTAIQLAYSPAPSFSSHRLGVALAHSKGSVGFGAGYQGDISGSLSHNAFVGLGAHWENISLGLGARAYAIESGISPRLDGAITAELKIIDLGLVFYDLNTSPRLGVGLGTKSGHRFNLEANVLLPPFSMLDSGYQFTISAQLSAGIVSVYFRTTYFTAFNDISHTLGLGGWAGENVYLGLQYSTPSRLTAGVTFTF